MHYLDHAATTPVLPEVRDTISALLGEDFGNPSSTHAYGRRAKAEVETARERLSQAVGAAPAEITFTGTGTEADNLTIKGAVHKRRGNGDHVVVAGFEHHAVLDTAEWLRAQSLEITFLRVPASGVLDPDAVGAAVRPSTLLVSVMAVNNEVGTVQPIEEIVTKVKAANPNALVHTDAVQALGNIPVDLHRWGVDLAAFSAHKVGGPKGVGAAFVRSGVPVEPLTHGGGQERGLRSGTLNVAGIAGFGVAAEIAAKEVETKASQLRPLRDRLFEGLREAVPDLVVNGDLEDRVPGNLHVSVPGTEGETLLLLLDREGIAASAGSACASGAVEASHVLRAMGVPEEAAIGSIRFSLGRGSTSADVDAVIDAFPAVVEKARRAA